MFPRFSYQTVRGRDTQFSPGFIICEITRTGQIASPSRERIGVPYPEPAPPFVKKASGPGKGEKVIPAVSGF
jgi:hypothetical protein